MKNNKITFPQFLSTAFLSSLSFILFVNNIPSIYLILSAALSLLVNLFVFMLYKGQTERVLKAVCAVYLTLYCVIVISKFTDYMNNVLSYGPPWLIMAVLLGFIFFCTVKGIEAVARASAVIAFFCVIGLLYMFICSVTKIKFNLSLSLPNESMSVITLLLPSALYVLYFDNIIDYKPRPYLISCVMMLLVYIYFIVIASDAGGSYPVYYIPANSKIGVFKGSDCILLALLTISVVYSASSSAVGILKKAKHKYLTNSIYIAVLFIFSFLASYFEFIIRASALIFVPATLAVVLVIILTGAFGRKSMYKNS